ncbi:MAG: D-tyrosyl-tRNA(Tyr) deacylase [Bacteroidetes bacterium]|nr:D-tyrosyl-tRNA(Tyr) deacylase [Bacteroidota bacterium]MBU1422477.1 D-tyrosyl-tRNA(Tyr) deacylase [Bacteroidota bacterium]
MRALIQRVKKASVSVTGDVHGSIGKGMLIFLGVSVNDNEQDAKYLAEKCANLRIFEDSQEKMNLSMLDVNAGALVISQFTLYADTRRGNRPSFTDAAPPDKAEMLYDIFVKHLRSIVGDIKVKTGVFRAMMDVGLINDGPVTIMLESKTKNNGS